MPIVKKEDIQVNTSYWYEDIDVLKILTAKIYKYYSLNDIQAPDIYACVDNISLEGQEGQLTQRLKQWENAPDKKNMLLIPCNLGMGHWVGILVNKDANGKVDRAEYVDSLNGYVIDPSLKSQFNIVYSDVELIQKQMLKQADGSSCGAYTVDNLFFLATNNNMTPPVDVNNVDIRLEHLKLLRDSEFKDDRDFYQQFVTRQQNNQAVVRGLSEQLTYLHNMREVRLKSQDKIKIKKIQSNLELLKKYDVDLFNRLFNVLKNLDGEEIHAKHLTKIREGFIFVHQSIIETGNTELLELFIQIKNNLFLNQTEQSFIDNDTLFSLEYDAILAITQEEKKTGITKAISSYVATPFSSNTVKIQESFSSQTLTTQRPSKVYTLSNYKFEVNNKEVTFVEYLEDIEKKRNNNITGLTSKVSLDNLLNHLQNERFLIEKLEQCLLGIDLKKSYGAITLKNNFSNDSISFVQDSSYSGKAVPPPPPPPPSGKAVPQPPPPPPPSGKAVPPPLRGNNAAPPPFPIYIESSEATSINALKDSIKRYAISSSKLPDKLAELTSKDQVIAFLNNVKKELIHIEKIIITELAIQDKVPKRIEKFLDSNSDILKGTDNHTKISNIKMFLRDLYREIYVEGEYNLSLIGLSPLAKDKEGFYPLDYKKHPYTSLIEKSAEEINRVIGEEIENIVESIRTIKDIAQDKGNFNAAHLLSCLKNLSKVEQEAFIALNLDESAKKTFNEVFRNNKEPKNTKGDLFYSELICDECLIALDLLDLFLSLESKSTIKDVNELGIFVQNDLEKLFFILMQSSSLEITKYNETSILRSAIKSNFQSANLANIGLPDLEQVVPLLKGEDFELSKDPISGIPIYCFGFIDKKLLNYLVELKSTKTIKLNKEKFKQLFKAQFGRDISEEKMAYLENEMKEGLRKLCTGNNKVTKSSIIEHKLYSDLSTQVKNSKERVQERITKHKEEIQEQQKDLPIENIVELSLKMQKQSKQAQKNYEDFCSNVFDFIPKVYGEKTGLIFSLANFSDFLNAIRPSNIIKGAAKNKLTSKPSVAFKDNVRTPKEYMTSNINDALYHLLEWLDQEKNLQLQLLESEYERLRIFLRLLSKQEGIDDSKQTYKESFATQVKALSEEQKKKVKEGASEFKLMDNHNQKQNLQITASKLKGFLQLNNDVFVVNLYNKINTLDQAKNLLTVAETIDFLKGVMYRDLVVKFKNSTLCKSKLLKQIKDKDNNVYEYFQNLQELIDLRNKFFNQDDMQETLSEIKEKIGIDLLIGNFLDILETISGLKASQFKELIEILGTHPHCPNCFKKIITSKNDINEDHEKFKNIFEDIKIYTAFISDLQEHHKQILMDRGIPLNGINSIEEASNNLTSNMFSRFIVDCMIQESNPDEQIKESFEFIAQIKDFDNLTEAQIEYLNEAIQSHTEGEILFDVKYFGLSQELIDRDCVFCARNIIDADGNPTVKYTTLTKEDMPANNSSYYDVHGFKVILMELLESYSKFLDKINEESLLDNFTLVELAIIVRCLNLEHLSLEEEQLQLIGKAQICTGNNGEGLAKDFVDIISEKNVATAITDAIQHCFFWYIQNFINELSIKDIDDKEKLINMIDNGEGNIFNIIKEKINRNFYQQGILLDLSLSIDSARQTIDNIENLEKDITLLELLNKGSKADSTAVIEELNRKGEDLLLEEQEKKTEMLQEAFVIAVNKAREERDRKIKKWELDSQQLHLIPEQLAIIFRLELQKGIHNLNLEKDIFQKILNENQVENAEGNFKEKLTQCLEGLSTKIDDFIQLKTDNGFDSIYKKYKLAGEKSFQAINLKCKEIIANSNQLFEDDSLVDKSQGSIYQLNYKKLFEPALLKLISDYESFVNVKNGELSNLQQQLIQAYSLCIKKRDEIKSFIDTVKQELNIHNECARHTAELTLDDIKDQVAEQLLKQQNSIEEQHKVFEESKQEMFKIQLEKLEMEEQIQRATLERESIGEALPEVISQMLEEADEIHQKQVELKKELSELISEEIELRQTIINEENKEHIDTLEEKFKAIHNSYLEKTIATQEEVERLKDLTEGRIDIVSLREQLRKGLIDQQKANNIAVDLYKKKQITAHELRDLKTGTWRT